MTTSKEQASANFSFMLYKAGLTDQKTVVAQMLNALVKKTAESVEQKSS